MKDNFKAWEIVPLSNVDNVSKIELMRHLIGWAILAPNAHNIQPWKFILQPNKNTISICLDKRGILEASDKVGREAIISLGCSIANLIIASKYYGLAAELCLPEKKKRFKIEPSVIAEFTFKNWQPKICQEFQHYLQAMKNRRVNRSPYDPQKRIPEEFEKEMVNIARAFGSKIFTVRDIITRKAIAKIQFIADRHVMLVKEFRKELVDVILPNDTDKYVGIPGNTLGLSDDMTLGVIEGLKQEVAGDSDLVNGNARASQECIKSSPLICVVAGKKDTPHWWLKAGMTFGAIAIAAEAAGLNIAVHAAIMEVRLLRALLKLRLFTTATPLVLFRLGYAMGKMPHSPRLNIESVTEISKQ